MVTGPSLFGQLGRSSSVLGTDPGQYLKIRETRGSRTLVGLWQEDLPIYPYLPGALFSKKPVVFKHTYYSGDAASKASIPFRCMMLGPRNGLRS